MAILLISKFMGFIAILVALYETFVFGYRTILLNTNFMWFIAILVALQVNRFY